MASSAAPEMIIRNAPIIHTIGHHLQSAVPKHGSATTLARIYSREYRFRFGRKAEIRSNEYKP